MSEVVSRLGEVASGTSYTAGNDIFSTDLVNPRWGALRLCVCTSAAAVPYVRYNSVNMELNAGAVIGADDISTFVFALPAGVSFNLRLSASGTIRTLTIDYVPGAVT